MTQPVPATVPADLTCIWGTDEGRPCGRPAAARTGARGPNPKYCEQGDGPGQPVHNAKNAWRLQQQPATGSLLGEPEGEAGYTMARLTAAETVRSALELARTLNGLGTRFEESVATMQNPDKVQAELDSARRTAEAGRQQAEDGAAVERAARLRADEAAEEMARLLAAANEGAAEARQDAAVARERLTDAVREHTEQMRVTAAQQRAELDQVKRGATQAIEAAQAEGNKQVRAAERAAEDAIAVVRDEAGRLMVAAQQAVDRALAKADTATKDAAAARQETAGANARAGQAAAETERVRDGYEQQLTVLRGDAEREREQAAVQLTEVRDAAAREREQLLEQVTDLRGRAGQLTLELERGRQAAAEDRDQMRGLYEGQVAVLTVAVADTREQAAAVRGRLEEAVAELRRLREGQES